MAKDTCTVDGCETPQRARGWCASHYYRWERYGDPAVALARPPATTEDRFWRKVEKGGADECWPWVGALSPKGYGRFRTTGLVGAHRFSWELANGRPVPAGLHVMHACDNPPCVNPAHLSVGTHTDNMRDCRAKGRHPVNRGGPGRVRKHPVEVVADLRAQGMTQREIATQLGISQASVWRALRVTSSPCPP